jgi:stress responsive alpha/beta barrel protein
MKPKMRFSAAMAAMIVIAAGLFAGGYALGQHKFGTPKSVIHIAIIKWKAGVPDAEKQKVLDGVKAMAGIIPGIKNVWLQGDRIQPRDFNAAFAIEFENRAAADAYAESPVHKAWDDHYLPLRETSLSIQVTNP